MKVEHEYERCGAWAYLAATSRTFKPLTFNGMLLEGPASADAQVLIAFGPEEAWDVLLSKPIRPRTSRTVTDPELLRQRWRTIKREGVGFDWGEWNPEAPAVAVPLFNQSGQLRGAMSVVAPIERATEEAMARHAEALKRTAAEISARLG
jgi:DNA-binding IclR family transcriptional regulator